jgi:hypothetical protein
LSEEEEGKRDFELGKADQLGSEETIETIEQIEEEMVKMKIPD